MLVQGLKGSYIIQSPRCLPKIQEIAFKNAEFCWIPCPPEINPTYQAFVTLQPDWHPFNSLGADVVNKRNIKQTKFQTYPT